MYHGVAFHTNWSLWPESSCYAISLQLAHKESYCAHMTLYVHTQLYIYIHSLTCTHRVLHIHTWPYRYRHGLTCPHIALCVHTQSYMYKHSFICTHRALHVHTQSYICTHTAFYVHTSTTCLNTFMVGRVEIKYKLQSLLTLQINFLPGYNFRNVQPD